mgnify:CR=1 FL=1
MCMANQKTNSTILLANLTKSGLVSVWEAGGGATNTGDATIICKADGSKPTATYIRRSGHLAGAEHALVPVHPGYYLIKSYHHRKDFIHEVYRIIRAYKEGEGKEAKGKIEVILVNKYEQGEWSRPLPESLINAVNAAEDKATNYHCREAVYVTEKETKD